MGVSIPSDHPDKALVWNEEFRRRRAEEVETLLTDELIAEHGSSWILPRLVGVYEEAVKARAA